MLKNITNKLLLLVFIIFINISLSYTTKAFLDWWLGTNLYKNIDEGLDDLEFKMFQKEINIEWNIDNTINNYAKSLWEIWCFDNLKIKDKNEYITIWETYDFIDFECLDNWWKKGQISIDEINNYRILINDFIRLSNYNSELKTQKAYEIASLWLFTDWVSENSPFDLIVDLQEIDKIIFNNKINYDSEDLDFLSSFKKDPSTIIKVKPPKTEKLEQNPENWDTDDNPSENWEIIPDEEIINTDGNNYNCPWDSSASGLSPEEQEKLIKDISSNEYALKISDNGVIKMPKSNQLDIPDFWNESFSSKYKWVNDNSFWPCNDFFCIEIWFDTYNTKALDYSSSISIENVIDKSNSHFRKAKNVMLNQTKMSWNNFETQFRNLDLVWQFHLSFIMKPKSPPILNLENIIEKKWKSKDNPLPNNNDKRSALNQLENYYNKIWLDYNRSNDMNMFRKTDSEEKKVINNTELTPSFIVTRNEIESWINHKIAQELKYITKSYDMDLNNDILWEFYEESVELNWFIISVIEYTKELNTLIIALKEIPIFKE